MITMQCVSGIILDPGSEPFKGYLCWDEGIIVELGKGTPPVPPLAKGIITTLFINGHTHIGDSRFSGMIDHGLGLRNIVDPPDGLKHRLLRTTPDSEIVQAMRESLNAMARTGTRGFLDFREGGGRGVSLLQQAFRDREQEKESQISTPTPHILSRPAALRHDKEEISHLLEHSIGIGISAMRDWEYPELEKIAAQVHSSGKLLSLHASETVREDIDRILDLKPDILVHLTSATPSDLELVADAGVQVVVCPRTNSLFGFLPDIPLMLGKGISLSLGTDNLMFSSPDMFREMDFTWRIAHLKTRSRKAVTVPVPGEILRMAGYRLRKALNVKPGVSQGEKACFLVLSSPVMEPGSAPLSLIHGGKISLIVNKISQWEVQ